MSGRTRVIILGAGFGGLAAATRLRALLPTTDEVVLVDRRRDFVMGLRKTWEIVGQRSLAEGTRPIATLRARGIDVREATVEHIEPTSRRITLDGHTIEGDALVVALGAVHAPEAVAGLAEHGINVWDRSQTATARAALAAFPGGRLVIGIFGVPYACPPGPFELALLARETLAARGVAASVEVFGPMPIALPVVGPVESAKFEAILGTAGIPFHGGRTAAAVKPGTLVFGDGDELAFDLLFAVPPHRCPTVLVEAGLASEGGWVAVDPRTVETSFPGVYAVGDCTVIPLAGGLPLPKAGVFAEAEGHVAAERIAAGLGGRASDVTFEGEGACFTEVGGALAVEVHGRFLADPRVIEIDEPSAAAMAAKVAFERERLGRWFGAGSG